MKRPTTLALAILASMTLHAATYTVTNTNDSGAGSLREALTSANSSVGADNVYFNIPLTDPGYNAVTGTWIIALQTTLPLISTGYVNIDATTQQSNQGNTNLHGYEIILLRNGTMDYPLAFVSPGNTFKGFIVQGFTYGLMIYNSTATGNTITQNYFGTNFSATAAAAQPNTHGIAFAGGASGNTISNNIISGNTLTGIAITGSSGNIMKSNRIGTDSTGVFAIPNNYGIGMQDASSNIIGSLAPGEFNLISGNTTAGIVIDGLTSTGNQVFGNRVGTDINGTTSISNESGIILSYASHTIIGGTTYRHRNIISGNSGNGIVLNGTGTQQNLVKGNFIGTDISGMAPLSNYSGISILSNANSNTIGGLTVPERNIISGNFEMGVYIESSDSNVLINNFFGPDSTGLNAFKIAGDSMLQGNGVEFNTVSKYNILGGYTAAERNLISGNRLYGMVYYGNCNHNSTIGNYIGTDVSGNAPLPNATGICVDGGSNHNPIINNVLSGNYSYGIFIVTTGTYYNVMKGNILGLNAAGTDTLPNDAGLLIGGGTKYNVIGGSATGERNIFSGNRFGGIEIADVGTCYNLIRGNYIGTDKSGMLPKPNLYGVSIVSGCSANTLDSNVISGNRQGGVLIYENADSNNVTRNYIGTGSDSTIALGNGVAGVVLWNGASYNKIGGNEQGNVIAYNDSCGIVVKDDNALYNTISGNNIYQNHRMGIDLFPMGPNANDAGDTDSGPNEGMNYPLFQHAAYGADNGTAWIYGILDTQMPGNAVIELFRALPDTGIINHGEGQQWLGQTLCDASGNWMFFASGLQEGMLVTATATSVDGNTSEFSANYMVIASVSGDISPEVLVYPNPCRDYLMIVIPAGQIRSFAVITAGGKRVYQKNNINDNSFNWNFGNTLQSGLYFAEIELTNGSRSTQKITVIR